MKGAAARPRRESGSRRDLHSHDELRQLVGYTSVSADPVGMDVANFEAASRIRLPKKSMASL